MAFFISSFFIFLPLKPGGHWQIKLFPLVTHKPFWQGFPQQGFLNSQNWP